MADQLLQLVGYPVAERAQLLSDEPISDPAQDHFGFRDFADSIAQVIDDEDTDTPLTVAISGPWGGGKTSVARMVESQLRNRAEQRYGWRPNVICRFSAWAHHDSPQLGAALAAAVARTASQRRPRLRRLIGPLPATMLTARERRWRLLRIAIACLVAAVLVIAIEPVGDQIASAPLVGDNDAAGMGSLAAVLAVLWGIWLKLFAAAEQAARFIVDPATEATRGTVAQVRDQLGDLIRQGRRDGRLVIFVDDLERCRPERAVEVCEVVSQLLSHRGVVTVLIADMQAIATSADAVHSHVSAGRPQPGELGRRFLEKIVQIQVTLPPPRQDDMLRLLSERRPRHTTAEDEAGAVGGGPVRPQAETDSDTSPGALAGANLIVAELSEILRLIRTLAVMSAALAAPAQLLIPSWDWTEPVIFAGVAVAIVGSALIQAFERVLARGLMREYKGLEGKVKENLHDRFSDPGEEAILAEIEASDSPLGHVAYQSVLLEENPERPKVERVIFEYPPALPRAAKRMLNHARLLTDIARRRDIFGGAPSLDPEHLGEWIVLNERWPSAAQRIAANPAFMAELEDAAAHDCLDEAAERLELNVEVSDELAHLLTSEPRLSPVVERLIHFEPAHRPADSSELRVPY